MQVARPGWHVTLPPCHHLAPVPQAGTLQLCLELAVKTEQELRQEV